MANTSAISIENHTLKIAPQKLNINKPLDSKHYL